MTTGTVSRLSQGTRGPKRQSVMSKRKTMRVTPESLEYANDLEKEESAKESENTTLAAEANREFREFTSFFSLFICTQFVELWEEELNSLWIAVLLSAILFVLIVFSRQLNELKKLTKTSVMKIAVDAQYDFEQFLVIERSVALKHLKVTFQVADDLFSFLETFFKIFVQYYLVRFWTHATQGARDFVPLLQILSLVGVVILARNVLMHNKLF